MGLIYTRDDAARFERRATSIERAAVDLEAGTFPMIAATEGEATDGHIISLAGLETRDGLPLQVDHSRATQGNVGSVSGFRVERPPKGPAFLRATGAIRVTGEGEGLAARMDLLDAISTGDVGGVSLSWEGVTVKERRDLPKDHPAYVSSSEKDFRKRYGLFFEKSVAREVSITPFPADRAALIERADRSTGESASMFADLAARAETLRDLDGERYARIIETLEAQVESLQRRVAQFTPDPDAQPRGETPARSTVDELIALLGQAVEDIARKHDKRSEARINALADRIGRSLEHASRPHA